MNNTHQSAGEVIERYLESFSARNSEAISRLFSDTGLLEIPMVQPSRLVGRDEVHRAHVAIFATVSEAVFMPNHGSHEQDRNAIWTGELQIKRSDQSRQTHKLAIVATLKESGLLTRLTLHLNARHLRRWSDPAIL